MVIENTLWETDSMVLRTRRPVVPPSGHKNKVGDNDGSKSNQNCTSPSVKYQYSYITSEVRSFYKAKKDWGRAEPCSNGGRLARRIVWTPYPRGR